MGDVLMKCGCTAQGVRTGSGGVMHDPIPVCITHDCTDVAESKPDLTGRMAKCTYSHANPRGRQEPGKSPVPSSYDLAFFEYRGAGSREATDKCVCGYAKIAHEKNAGKCPKGADRYPPSREFTAKGPQEFDHFYCGCFGWD